MLKIFRKIDPRLSAELKKQKRPIVLGLLCATVTSLLTAATIPMVNFAVHAITVKDLDQLLNVCVGVVGLFTVKYFFTRGQVYFLSYAANSLASDMRLRLFEKLQRLPISYFNAKRAGAIQSVLSNDVNVYQTAVTLIRDSIDGPLKATAAFVSVFVLQWQLGLVALLSIPILAWLVQQNSKRVRRAQSQVQKDLSELTAMSQESLQGTRVIRAFSAEEQMRDEYGTLIEQSMKSQMTAVRRIATLRPMVEWLGAVTLAAILYLCGIMAKAGTLTVADIAALLVALDVINQGQRNIASVSNTYSQVQAAADRIYGEVLDYPEQHAEEAGKKTLPAPSGRIEFKSVGFQYPDGTRALKDVSFSIEPGTSLALVGSSGAGKSTIADLLLRFYDPTEGSIHFDGQIVRDLNAVWLRNQIGVVPQQTFLFAGTIAENIRLGAPDATDEEIREAAKTAHADVFIDDMPEGYDTYLGERGIRLSGGEMQRIAIARAVIRKPRVLLLDEATSNLDAVSEKAVQEALEEVMKGRTTLFIAHRLSTAARADKILVLSHGAVMEYGSHSELLAAKGPYSAMFDAFSKGVMDESVG